MGESENPLLNEFWAAQSSPQAAGDGDQCLKQTLNACKSFKRKRIADNGQETNMFIAAIENHMGCGRLRFISIGLLEFRHLVMLNVLPDLQRSSNTLMTSEQEIECGGASMELVSGFLKQKQFKEDIQCRLISCDARTKGRKRSQSSHGLPTLSVLKRSKRSSPAKRRPSSIDDLPDVALVEILCRLPSSKFVFQCQSVSKRWHSLISDPYFIGRFVHIQRYRRTPKIRKLISKKGEEFPPKMPWPSKLLTPVFKRITSFDPLKREPVVVATYNDLVLCCASKYYPRDYYFCNAYTRQWVALPLQPQVELTRLYKWDSSAIFPTMIIRETDINMQLITE